MAGYWRGRTVKLNARRAMEILAVVPTDEEVTVQTVALDTGVHSSDQTVKHYLEQMVRDGWLARRRSGVVLYRRLWYLDKFFTPRDLPQIIWIREDPVIGPFCSNCGWNVSGHGGPRHRCPVDANPLLARAA